MLQVIYFYIYFVLGITGYVRNVFRATRIQNTIFCYGSITNGEKKIAITIDDYSDKILAVEMGHKISVTGKVIQNSSQSPVIKVISEKDIKIIDNANKESFEFIYNGYLNV